MECVLWARVPERALQLGHASPRPGEKSPLVFPIAQMGVLRHTAEVSPGDGTTVGAGQCDSEPVPVTTTLSPSGPTACGSEERATGGGWADLSEACGRLPTVVFWSSSD